jgi:hypothetical protein
MMRRNRFRPLYHYFILKRLDGLLSKIILLAEYLSRQLADGYASDIYAEITKVIEHHVAQINDRLNEAHA